MPLIGLYESFATKRTYADRSGGIGSQGNNNPERVIFQTRHPEGRYIPLGRGIYGGKPLPQQTDRRDIVPVTVGTPIVKPSLAKPQSTIVPTLVGKADRPGPSARPPVIRRSPLPQEKPTIPTKQAKVPKMGLDLGNLLNTGLDLYGKYLGMKNPVPTAIAAPAAVVAAPVAQTYWPEGYGVNQMAGPQFISNTPGAGLDNPFGELIAQPPDEALAVGMKGWSYKKSCGEWKWVKTGGRRRRKLLTDSDYNGLLKLQTLKVNSNMNIAIAKSIGR